MFWVCKHECDQLYLSCDYWSISATWWRDRHIITAFKSTLQNQQFNNSYISTKPQKCPNILSLHHPASKLVFRSSRGVINGTIPSCGVTLKTAGDGNTLSLTQRLWAIYLVNPWPDQLWVATKSAIRTIWWAGRLWQAIEGSKWLQAWTLCKVEDFVNLAIIKLCCRAQWMLRVWQFYFQLAYILKYESLRLSALGRE